MSGELRNATARVGTVAVDHEHVQEDEWLLLQIWVLSRILAVIIGGEIYPHLAPNRSSFSKNVLKFLGEHAWRLLESMSRKWAASDGSRAPANHNRGERHVSDRIRTFWMTHSFGASSGAFPYANAAHIRDMDWPPQPLPTASRSIWAPSRS